MKDRDYDAYDIKLILENQLLQFRMATSPSSAWMEDVARQIDKTNKNLTLFEAYRERGWNLLYPPGETDDLG